MSNQHTPGPWTYHFEEPGKEWALVMSGGPGGALVANVNTKSCPTAQSAPAFRVMPAEANARLIAAAPDLLSALRALVGEADLGEIDMDDEDRAKVEAARNAIAKAENNT